MLDVSIFLQELRVSVQRGVVVVESLAPGGGTDGGARWVNRMLLTPEEALHLCQLMEDAVRESGYQPIHETLYKGGL